ncbi:transporter suffix domain-containing protein [Pseudomonas sp. v388]|nr:transporter suffix domain-containing protein [Pseudomonas sp. v388]
MAAPSEGWRFQCGIGLIILMAASWALVPLASMAGATGATIATLVGVLFISNKVLLIAAIAVMGKSGFQQLKAQLHKHVKSFMAWPAEVGVVRHRVGVALFCIPVVAAFLDHHLDMFAPQLAPYKLQLRLLGDVLLVASLFMLGANFWEKLRALFIRTAKVATP